MEPILQLGVGGAIVLGVLYLGWQTLKVILDIRKNVQPLAANGNAGKMIEILNTHTVYLREMVEISRDHKSISLNNSEKLSKLDSNLTLAMDRQKTNLELVKDIKDRSISKSIRRKR